MSVFVFLVLEDERQVADVLLVWFVVQKSRSASTQRGAHAGDGYVSWNWRRTEVSRCGGSGSLSACCSLAWLHFTPHPPQPFMSPNNQQQPCCLDQWFANFHTRHKQRLNMGAEQQCVESVSFSFFFCSACGLLSINMMSTGALAAYAPADRQTLQ